MILSDLHVHTTYCDGNNTPEEMVVSAIKKGMQRIGFSSHSYTFFDESYCMKEDCTKSYKHEIAELKEKYKNEIEILCGVEQDYYSKETTDGYDFVIGSVHYIKKENIYIPIDENEKNLTAFVNKFYDGDYYKLADDYYNNVSKIKNVNIIGHFDLITKFNENNRLFDEKNEKYIQSYQKALDVLLKQDVIFEINTGAVSKGYKTIPYPNRDIIEYIKAGGGKFIFSSDAHSSDELLYYDTFFDNEPEYRQLFEPMNKFILPKP